MTNYIGTHWGTYKFFKDKKEQIKLDNFEIDPSPTEYGLGLAEAAIDDLRITQPHVRKGWLENPKDSKKMRGKDKFIPISWDKV